MEEWIEGEEVGVVGLSTAEAHFFQDREAKGWMNSIAHLQVLWWLRHCPGAKVSFTDNFRMSWMGKQWLSCVLASCSGENIQPVLFDKAILLL